MTTIGFSGIFDFLKARGEAATDDLTDYFTRYTGRWFEYFSAQSDQLHLNANDLCACAALSVELDGETVDGLMSKAGEFDALLARSPARDVTLWQVDPTSDSYGALSDLYVLVREVKGMGVARTSKLIACKRPHLVPIRDSVVDSLLNAGTEWWSPWRDVVSSPELVSLVEDLSPPVVPAGTSILRRLDVMLWMYGKNPGNSDA
jgi:Family of unknown function (DUF6308)